MIGMAVGYYVAITGGLPISEGLLVLVALTSGALMTTFYLGRARTAEAQPHSFNESWDSFRNELDRSRRFERPFVLMRIPANDARGASAAVPAARGTLGTLPLVIRGIDQAWTMEGSIYVVLPESNRAAAQALIARLRSTMPEAAELDDIHIAEFPEDGLTTGALVANLRAVPAPGEAPPVRLVPARDDGETELDTRTG